MGKPTARWTYWRQVRSFEGLDRNNDSYITCVTLWSLAMPRKKQISREAIEGAAFDLVRGEGIAALSARRLGEVLGCSTQPVYSACGSMAQVESAVVARTQAWVEGVLAKEDEDVPFLRLGLATVALARDEPHLFDLASPQMIAQVGRMPPAIVLGAMRGDPRLSPLSNEQLKEVHSQLLIFSQGLAAIVRSKPTFSMSAARRSLESAGEAIIEYAVRRPRS